MKKEEQIKTLKNAIGILQSIFEDSRLHHYAISRDELQEILNYIQSIPDPAPLDPHTCELCVGDVVLFYNKELVVQRIEGEKIYAASSISVHEYSRDEITLKSNQRAGVQIGKV